MLNEALKQLAQNLESRGISYTVIGAIALNLHGYQRFTSDIDLLMSAEGLERFSRELVGRGYRPAFPGATKKFRATEQNVPIEIIVTGEYPGDGKPKSVRFPDPAEAFVVRDGIRTLPLERLVELKLASGLTAPHRLKDLADVQELIRIKQLPPEFAEQLEDSVRAKFRELYEAVAQAQNEGWE